MLSTKLTIIGVVAIACLTVSFVVGALTGLLFRASLVNLLVLVTAWGLAERVRNAETVERFLRENLPPTAHHDKAADYRQARGVFQSDEPAEEAIRRLRGPVEPVEIIGLTEISAEDMFEISRMSKITIEHVIQYLYHRGYTERQGKFYANRQTKTIAFGPIPPNWRPEAGEDDCGV